MSNGGPQLTLPKEKLPDLWNDEKRMNVLFAPFRTKSVNPHDWESKLTFWKKLILDSCIHSQVYSFKYEDLQKLFNVNGRSPSGLNVVVEEMLKSNEIQPLEQFLQRPSKSWSSWAADVFIKKPLTWSYSKIRNTFVAPTDIKFHTYVHIGAIKADANKMISNLPDDFKNGVISLKELLDVMGVDASKANHVKYLLHYLLCNGQVDIREIKADDNPEHLNNVLIKFGSLQKLEPITDIDVSIHILEQTEKMLSVDLEKLENQVLNFIEEAKGYIKKGHRQMAKSCLRKKQEVDKRVSQKANTLHNVQLLLHKLEDTDTNSQVLDSYKLALSTLKKNFQENGLSEDPVSDTVFELGEILDVHEEIQKTLSQSLSGNDEELEEELQELIISNNLPPPPDSTSPSNPKSDSDTEDLEKRLQKLKLPSPPADNPSVKQKISL